MKTHRIRGISRHASRTVPLLVFGSLSAEALGSYSVRPVHAPRATGSLPCSASDFRIRRFSGTYPVPVPANRTTRLSALGVGLAERPQITMLNRPSNQNGCQGAMISLRYTGTATQ